MSEETSKNYELTLISSPNLSEAELKSLEEEAEGKIKELGGKVLSAHGRSPAGRDKIELAYLINKHKSANFSVLGFSLSPEKVQELSDILKRESRLLRYLISHPLTKKNPKTAKKKSASGRSPVGREVKGEAKEEVKEKPKEEIKMEEIDKKLDELLEG